MLPWKLTTRLLFHHISSIAVILDKKPTRCGRRRRGITDPRTYETSHLCFLAGPCWFVERDPSHKRAGQCHAEKQQSFPGRSVYRFRVHARKCREFNSRPEF